MDEKGQRELPAPTLLRRLWRLIALGIACVIILLALAIGLFRVLVPLVPDYHQRIEAAAGAALGFAVTFERVDARWRLRGPELVFFGANVYEAVGGRQLASGVSGHVNLNVGALITQRAVVPDSILLRGVDLQVARDAGGHYSIFGYPLTSVDSSSAPTGKSWPLPNGRFELREASLHFRDADKPLTVVRNIVVNLDVDGTRMRVDGRITPPEAIGDGVEFSAELDGSPARLGALRWQVYVAGSDVDLAALNTLLVMDSPLVLSARGDCILWAGFVGAQIQHASVELDMRDVGFAGQSLAERYTRVRGRAEWDVTANGWRSKIHGLDVQRLDRVWPTTTVEVESQTLDGGTPLVTLATPFVRIDDLVPLVALLPPSALAQRLLALKPSGDLRNLRVTVPRDDKALAQVDMSAEFAGVSIAGDDKLPAVSGLTGALRADALGGRLELDSDAFGVFSERHMRGELSAWRLTGSAVWRKVDDGWQIISDRILLATADFDALARVTVTLGRDKSPHVDARVDLGDIDVARVRNYLPVPLLSPKLVAWLDQALVSGTFENVSAQMRGHLADYPYVEGGGEFNATLGVRDLTMAYAQDWPPAQDVQGTVRFDGSGVFGDIESGRLLDVPLGKSSATIADLSERRLVIESGSQATLAQLRDYYRASPPAQPIADLLDDMDPRGGAEAVFRLDMPLKEWRDFDFRLDVKLQDNDLGYKDWPYRFEQTNGLVVLTRREITTDGVTALLLGRPVDVRIFTEALTVAQPAADEPRAIIADVAGRMDANVLAERLYAPLADYLRGSSEWTARVRFPPLGLADQFPLRVTGVSSLIGMAVTLPAPAAKAAEQSRPVWARLTVADADNHALEFSYGDDVEGMLELQKGAQRWGLRRGEIAFGGAKPTLGQQPGLSLVGSLNSFDFGAWLARAGKGDVSFASMLRTADVSIGDLHVVSQHVPNARVKVDRNVREWLIQVESDLVSGAVFYPFDASDGTPVIANLERLNWRSPDGNGRSDPRQLPALRIDVQDFVFDDKRLGALKMELDPTEDGLIVSRFETVAPSFTTTAGGNWRYFGGAPSQFDMTLTSTDLKSTMESMNTVGAIVADDASMTVKLFWDGDPTREFTRAVYGDVSIRVGDGQLLNVDPKAGRMFGLISLTALPRRLGLDFRDIFQKGFVFDAIEGDFEIRDGSAFTENMVLRGPAAQVGVVGRAGIADRDYDQTAVIYASFGSSLPIAGAIAGGPAVGAALLIFSELFKDPLKQMGRVDYRITGSWDDPVITRVTASNSGSDGGSPDDSGSTPANSESTGAGLTDATSPGDAGATPELTRE